jgi:lysophospholipase L1-like esterase
MGVFSWLRQGKGAGPDRKHARAPTSLQVESLEERCLLSAGPGLFGSNNPALFPEPLAYPPWQAELRQALVPRPDALIAFVGDSILYDYQYRSGAPSWNASIAPFSPKNIAIEGNRTGQVLWEIGNGFLADAAPRVIVLMIGVNNLTLGQTPTQTAEGIWATVTSLQATEPQAEILLLNILPTVNFLDPQFNQRIDETNRLISSLAISPRVRYVDVNAAFRFSDGNVMSSFFADGVHPNSNGYTRLSSILLPEIQSILAHTGAPVGDPVVGDWDGDGQDGLATVDPATGKWYLRNDTSSDVIDKVFSYGGPGWRPVAGDWDGDGDDDIGTFDPATARWYLRNDTSSGAPDHVFTFGLPGWIPIAGDWDGDGRDSIGIVDPQTGHWYLSPGLGSGPLRASFVYGLPGWVPVVGDWDNDGTDNVGMVDTTTTLWYINRFEQGKAIVDIFAYGGIGWDPIVGNWEGTGTTIASLDPNGLGYTPSPTRPTIRHLPNR